MISGYNFENIYLQYSGLKTFIPFLSSYDHGWFFEETGALTSVTNHKSKYHLSWNQRSEQNFKKKINKIIIKTGSPILIFKNNYKIKSEKKKKTLFFPSHTTSKISQDLSPRDFNKIIQKIPVEYHPVDICLHYLDYIKDANFYKEMGYDVYTAGKVFGKNFLYNFYNILSKYNFTMSNKLGTYTLMSVDLNIPFSLVGREPLYFNHSDDKNKPKEYKISDYSFGRSVSKLFRGYQKIVTNDQRAMVFDELGSADLIKKKDLQEIIFDELHCSFKNFENFINLNKQLLKQIYLFFKT